MQQEKDSDSPAGGWLRSVLPAVDHALIVTGPDGVVVGWSEGARQLLGFTPEEAAGRPRSDFSAAAEPFDMVAVHNQIAAAGQPPPRRLQMRCSTGDVRALDVFARPLRDSRGNPCGMVEHLVLGDPVDQFLHELREPLAATANYLLAVRVLLDRDAPPDRAKLQEAIASSLAQIARARDLMRRLRLSHFSAPGGAGPA